MTDETTQALLPVVPDFSRATLQTNIESILRNSRDVHMHSLTLMIMDAIPRAAPHSESDVVAALQALFDNYKELADSGDAGFWSLEDTPVGKQALAALENARHRLAHSLPSQADAGISEPTKRMEQTLGAKFQSAALTPPTSGEALTQLQAMGQDFDATSGEEMRLREAMERISKLTPFSANAATAEDFAATVHAIADAALTKGADRHD